MKIAVLAGDGVGPEVIAEAVKVLTALGREGLKLEFEQAPVGGGAYDAAGDPLPSPTLELAGKADAILFGAVGDPRYDAAPRAKRPEQALLRLRKELNLFANLRPAAVFPELADASTLRPEVVAGLDILIVRELTGDIYFGEPRGIRKLEGVCGTRSRKSAVSPMPDSARRSSAKESCARWTRRTCSRPRGCGARW